MIIVLIIILAVIRINSTNSSNNTIDVNHNASNSDDGARREVPEGLVTRHAARPGLYIYIYIYMF